MSLFHVGERYRDLYQVEYVVRFFDGELAVARKDSVRYYLQSAHLQKQAPSRAITQYRSLKHPLMIPFEEVYTEERSIVFIRPYVPIHPLREVVSTREVNEDQIIQWVKQLLVLEKELKSKPMKMYLLLDPRNIGLTEDSELKVFFCGIENITAQPKTLDWGTFIYSLLTGEYLEEPIDKVPADFGRSKWMIRLIQRSLGNDSPESILSHIENYERKKEGKGLFGILFKGEKKVRQKVRQNLGQLSKKSPAPPEEISPSAPAAASEAAKTDPPENEEDHPTPAENQIHKQDEEHLERLRQEFEQRQKELLEKQRLELERRQQELLKQQRHEFAQREEALLNQQKEEFKRQIEEPEQQKNWEREQQERERQLEEQKQKEEKARLEKEQLERELRKEQEKIAQEQEERLKAELEKVEQERIKWEQKQKDLEKKEEELREKLQREFDQMAKSLLEKQEQEFERRQNELLEKQRELLENKTKQRLEKQREELEQTSKNYLIPIRKKPQASLIDFGKEAKEKIAKQENLENKRQEEQERLEKERQEELERERLRKEKLAREKAEHDQLVKQFEEYMNQMYHTD